MVNGDDTFKRPGAVPFNWEIRPGVPKTRNSQPDDFTLLQPPKKLHPLRLKPLPSSNPPSRLSSTSISDSKSRPVSPFAPPPSFKPLPKSESRTSGPPSPYFGSYSARTGLNSGSTFNRWCFPKSLFGLKKSKIGDVKKNGHDSTSSESDNFYESETTFSPSEASSQGSVSTRWGSPKSSFSSFRGSPKLSFSSLRSSHLKRSESDLSSVEKQTTVMMARARLG